MRNIARQLQAIIATLADLSSKTKIYTSPTLILKYFGSTDHTHLLAIMTNLEYPPDAINLVGNIYSNSTSFQCENVTKSLHIPI